MPTVITVPTIVRITAPGPQGPKGLPGADGGSVTQLLAGTTLSGHRLVTKQSNDSVVYVDNTNTADTNRPYWLTLGSAISGAEIDLQFSGVVTEPSWAWTPGPLYLGTAGQLTQTVPVSPAVFLAQVGFATSATSIVLDRQPSIHLI